MTQIIKNSSASRRANISLAIMSTVFIYGLWELWLAVTANGTTTDYLFAFVFVGGSLYGLRTAVAETRDVIIGFEADFSSGQAALELWRPYYVKRIETTLDQITDWRLWIQTGKRDQRSFFLLAREPSYDGTLRIELKPGMTIPDELRKIAPEPIADFESETITAPDE